ncbi:response regulator [Legionella drozanskii]|uniref:Two component response regulator n=1 Tax=Legionella drozanskii LLAP-1 TaxID=1212489 RepID=A0A0W0SWK1_9GAMM|nr:response regulator [Legionella drozanskii]KTC87673.1 Two component response regulator [Legionella drozanskii LLAP-1]
MNIVDKDPTCFYHPTKIIFLDDNQEFLDAIKLEFDEKFNLLTLTSPDKALEIINKYSEDTTRSLYKPIIDDNVDARDYRILGFDISKTLELIYDKGRFEHTPVLVVDYEMPIINGIELCKKIKGNKSYKIMLTAEADKDTVIEAFNNGLIDKFILKTNKNLHSELALAVHDLTQRYFKELSKSIVNGHASLVNILSDNVPYQKLFAQVAVQAQAIEYYLVDNSGSILFLDKDAKDTWLIIRHKDELKDQIDLLDGYDLPAPTRTSVTNKEQILFLLTEKEYKKPIDDWLKYLFDARKLDDSYYYSITQNYSTDAIDWGKVTSYSSYIKERRGIEELLV